MGFSTNNHTLSWQNCVSNNGDVSSEYGFKNIHTLSQCEYSITFKDMDGDVEKGDGDVSCRYSF